MSILLMIIMIECEWKEGGDKPLNLSEHAYKACQPPSR